jgi:hypothetical protein
VGHDVHEAGSADHLRAPGPRGGAEVILPASPPPGASQRAPGRRSPTRPADGWRDQLARAEAALERAKRAGRNGGDVA